MQKIQLSILVLIGFILMSCNASKSNEALTVSPEKPIAGVEMTVNYNPAGSKIENVDKIEMVVYQYDVDLNSTVGLEMKKQGDIWTTSFTPAEDTKGMLVVFRGNDLVDDSNKQGYTIFLNDKNGNELPEAMAGFAVAQATWGKWYLDLAFDNELALNSFEAAFKSDSKIKGDYLDSYITLLSRLRNDSAIAKIKMELDELSIKNDLSENNLQTLAKFYPLVKDSESAQKFDSILMEKYPNSDYVKEKEYSSLFSEKNSKKLLNKIEKFSEKYNDSQLTKVGYYRIGRKFIDDGDYRSFEKLINKHAQDVHPYLFTYAVGKLTDNSKKKKLALKIAEMSVARAEKELNSPSEEQPKFETKEDWQKDRETSLSESLFDLAKVQNGQKDYSKALSNIEKSVKLNNGQEAEANELYSELLINQGKNEIALKKLEGFISDGKNTSNMIELLKKAYAEVKGSAEGFDSYIAKFTSEAETKLLSELKGEMINEPAPQFELTDLDGKTVKLADYKGKTVVVDFWATWCGPCKASFPAMKEAVTKFENNKNVEFLFLNTWERVQDKKSNAAQFIKTNNYPFHVLLDDQNEVVSKFKVSGIPTKFILDKDQNIRFKSIGFSGTNEELVAELSAMIKLLN